MSQQSRRGGLTVEYRSSRAANDLLFRCDTVTGAVEVVGRDGHRLTLNEALYTN